MFFFPMQYVIHLSIAHFAGVRHYDTSSSVTSASSSAVYDSSDATTVLERDSGVKQVSAKEVQGPTLLQFTQFVRMFSLGLSLAFKCQLKWTYCSAPTLFLSVPSTCLHISNDKESGLVSLLQLARPVLFLPAASSFLYNADQSQTLPYGALSRGRRDLSL